MPCASALSLMIWSIGPSTTRQVLLQGYTDSFQAQPRTPDVSSIQRSNSNIMCLAHKSAATPDLLLKNISGLVPVRRYEDATVKAANVLLLPSDACAFVPGFVRRLTQLILTVPMWAVPTAGDSLPPLVDCCRLMASGLTSWAISC